MVWFSLSILSHSLKSCSGVPKAELSIHSAWDTQINPKQARGGGGIRPQAGFSLYCAETVSSRKLKLCDFYYIVIGLNSEYKPVPWDIYCCHGNAIVEGCSVKFWQKSIEKCNFLLKSFSNFNLDLLFVIIISNYRLYQISSKSDKKQRS